MSGKSRFPHIVANIIGRAITPRIAPIMRRMIAG
jgi:hypothetical protein